jgi:RNA polymerase sigma-70 factor (ECF subfamily)
MMTLTPARLRGAGHRPSCAPEEALSEADGDAPLLARIRAGDRQAWEVFVKQYSGRMFAVAQRQLRCEADCADAVQEAFLSALQALDSFEGNSRLWTWLYRILVNTCLMKMRSRVRRPGVSLDDLLAALAEPGRPARSVPSATDQAFARLASAETRAQVRACIDLLPPLYRTVLLLRDIEELDTAATAQVLGLSYGAVKTRHHRARQGLRALLAPLVRETASISAQSIPTRPPGVCHERSLEIEP